MSNFPAESTLRRALKALGFRLIKSRARRWSKKNQCGYQIVMIGCEGVVWGRNFELTLEDVWHHVKLFS